MKCKLCEEYFISETKFYNLFVFEEICPKCKAFFEVKPKLEVFPIDYGLVYYYYMFDMNSFNIKQKEYLDKHINCLFKTIILESKKSLVVMIDDLIFEALKENIKYLIPYQSLTFMSLMRYDFESFVNLL